MKHKKLIAFILAFLPLAASAQEERIDTVIPKFLSNGYFFREMPTLPDGEKTILRLKDKEGNSVTVINVNATLPKSLIRKAIPREQVHNARQREGSRHGAQPLVLRLRSLPSRNAHPFRVEGAIA